jgi:hypothetical protein
MTRDDEIEAMIKALKARADQLQPVAAPVTPITPVGWLCPACGRGNAPINMTCPCKPWPEMRITC